MTLLALIMPLFPLRATWLLAAPLVVTVAADAQPAVAPPVLLVDAAPPPPASRLEPEAGHAARSRYVRLDLDALEDAVHRNTPAFTLDLFDGERVTILVERVEERGEGRRTWFGRVEGRAAEPASLAVERAAAAGRVVTGGRVYLLAYAGAGRHVLYEYAEAEGEATCHTLPAEEEADGVETWEPEEARVSAPPPEGAEEPLDLMIVYTGAVATALGEEGLAPYLQSLLDVLNAGFAAAGTPHTARLVAAREAAYDEDRNRPIPADLARLAHRSDGYLDDVHAWRDDAHADAVVLLVEEGANYCGVAYLNSLLRRSFARSAFAVVKRGCALGGLNFAHEVGHLLGIRHDVYVDPGASPAPYAHGFVNAAPAQNPPFRTVLAYPNRCNALGIHCPIIPAFSTTAVTLDGEALGDATADAARVFEESVPLVARFRTPGAPPRPPPLHATTDQAITAFIHIVDFLKQQYGDPVDLIALSTPSVGSVTHWGSYAAYTPLPEFVGTATFTYAFLDPAGEAGEGVVEVSVRDVNVPPTAPRLLEPPMHAQRLVFPASHEALEVIWEPSFDADGDTLTYTWHLMEELGAPGRSLLEVETRSNDRLEVPLARLAEALEAHGVPERTARDLFHRVSVSDGEAVRSSESHTLWLALNTPGVALRGPYPNPTRGPLALTLDLPENATLHLTLYDVLGRVIRVLEVEVAAGRSRKVALDLGGVAAGLYLYRVRATYGASETVVTDRLAILD